MEYKIELDYTPPSLNDLINKAKKHWGGYAQLKKKWKARVNGAIEKGAKPFTKPVVITVDLYFTDNRRRDLDNYVPKLLFDGLTKQANPYDYLVEDDSSKHIKAYTVRIFNGAEQEKTVITVRESSENHIA
jgi:Holliday junction resolvase RusA-like endonuclease